MKHIFGVSKRPAITAQWEEFICELSQIAAGLLTAIGGAVPIVSYLDTKCQPNPNLET